MKKIKDLINSIEQFSIRIHKSNILLNITLILLILLLINIYKDSWNIEIKWKLELDWWITIDNPIERLHKGSFNID